MPLGSSGAAIVSAPGDFVDEAGNLLGRHEGLSHYTVGMRRGLGVWAGERLYVKALIPYTNCIVLAPLNDMYTNQVRLKDILRLSPAMRTASALMFGYAIPDHPTPRQPASPQTTVSISSSTIQSASLRPGSLPRFISATYSLAPVRFNKKAAVHGISGTAAFT